MQSPKLPGKAGAVLLTIGGISATVTADSAREWLELTSQYGPLVLSGWLIYVIYKIDAERNKLKHEVGELKVKVAKMEAQIRINAY